MKIIRTLAVLLLIIIAVAMILMLIMPTKQVIQKNITIHAPASMVYAYLSKLDNFNKWAVWNKKDPTIRHAVTGTDGTTGAVSTWMGDPDKSGQGTVEITSLKQNQEVQYKITFLKPDHVASDSKFKLTEVNGATKLVWDFEIATPRPWNIFNLFSNLDKRVGEGFDESLLALKKELEKKNGIVTKEDAYTVEQLNYPETDYASYRQSEINWADVPDFYTMHFRSIIDAAKNVNATAGTPSALIYDWDEDDKQAEIAAAVPIPQGTSWSYDSIKVITLPASKAIYVDYEGDFDKKNEAYLALYKYLSKEKLEQRKPTIEEYYTDPVQQPGRGKMRIIFLVD